MNLYILRHAIAGQPGEGGLRRDIADADRPLTTEGRRKLRRSIKGMEAMGVRIDRVLTSPLLRARQTAEIVVKGMDLPADVLVVRDPLGPGSIRGELIREIARFAPRAANVVLVGHEPSLSELIGFLCTGDTNASIALKKGGLAKLEVTKLRHGRCAKLAWLLTPKQLRLMA